MTGSVPRPRVSFFPHRNSLPAGFGVNEDRVATFKRSSRGGEMCECEPPAEEAAPSKGWPGLCVCV